jgi:hypothetical protein
MKTIGIVVAVMMLLVGCNKKQEPELKCSTHPFYCQSDDCTGVGCYAKRAKSDLRWYTHRGKILGDREALLALVNLLKSEKIIKDEKEASSCAPYIAIATQTEKAGKDLRTAQENWAHRELTRAEIVRENADQLRREASRLKTNLGELTSSDGVAANAQELLVAKTEAFEKAADELRKEIGKNVPPRRDDTQPYREALQELEYELLALPIPSDIVGKACAYQAAVSRRSSDNSWNPREPWDKMAQAIVGTLPPDGGGRLRINPDE